MYYFDLSEIGVIFSMRHENRTITWSGSDRIQTQGLPVFGKQPRMCNENRI